MGFATARARQKKLLPTTFEQGLRRGLNKGLGLALVAASLIAWGSLMSWSISDPSLNLATDGPVKNLLGKYGAAFADINFQFLGLASIFLFLPLASWGLHRLQQRQIKRWHLRILASIFSAALIALTFSFLPKAGNWPLPQTFGGIIGDTLNGYLKINTLAGTSKIYWLAAFCAAGFLSTLMLYYACAIRLRDTAILFRLENPGEFKAALLEPFNRAGYWLRQRASIDPDYRNKPTQKWWRNAVIDETAPPPMPGRNQRPVIYSAGDHLPATTSPHRPQTTNKQKVARRAVGNTLPPMSANPDYSMLHENGAAAPHRPKDLAHSIPPMAAKKTSFELPSIELLNVPDAQPLIGLSSKELVDLAAILENVLLDFGVKGQILNVRPGPVVTLFEFEPARGTKTSRIVGLADDIARSMHAFSARIAVIPGRNAIGIELPNECAETVYLRELIESPEFQYTECTLPLILGRGIGGEPIITDLASMPHLLIAGTTGSGKSVGINTMLASLLYKLTPEQCRMIMIDPKMLELSVYDGIPHLLTPVVTDPAKAVSALKWAVREMEDRYRQMSKLGVRNIEGFNQRVNSARKEDEPLVRTVQTGFDENTGRAIFEQETLEFETLPLIVIIIDEMADLMMVAGKEIEATVQRLAQMARAAGIHVVMATQRPSVDVITGTIKANFAARISFQVTSKIDSRTILGKDGAEQLLGRGDMLYTPGGSRMLRVHGAFVDDDEVERIAHHLRLEATPEYLDSVITQDTDDLTGSGRGASNNKNDLYDEAVDIVLRDQKASISYLQRRLSIGYNKAATLIERMEEEGVVGMAGRGGKREILVNDQSRDHY